MIGRVVSHFRILEKLDEGGMGVVYVAEDVQLGRRAALKFLPMELTKDPDARERFKREARAASRLDHPAICTIYEVDETEDGQLYIAMGFYEGRTLKERLLEGPLGIQEAVDLAIRVCGGLVRAHEQGIVHRDIKPGNLMITRRGEVKILDFGIAKLAGEAGLTQTGVSLGTLAYMAPEQADASEVGPAADLWALGIVLYEMLAGRSPFARKSHMETIAAIMALEPDPLVQVRPEVPVELSALVSNLLTKDVAARMADAEAVCRRLASLVASPAGMPVVAAVGPPLRPWRWLAGATAGVVVVAFGTSLLLSRGGFVGEGPTPTGFRQLTNLPGPEYFPSLTPDGEWLVFANNSAGSFDVYLQGIAGGSPINLTADHDGDDTMPALSPDGRTIAFRSARDGGGVFVMGRTGESPRRVVDFGYNPTWSKDGNELYVSVDGNVTWLDRGPSAIWAIDVETGDRRSVTGEHDGVMAAVSPDGGRLAYWTYRRDGQPLFDRDVWTVGVNGGEPVPMVRDPGAEWNPVWAPDGRHLYFLSDRDGSMGVWRLRVDPASGKARSQPQPVRLPSSTVLHPGLSADGRSLVYVDYRRTADIFRVAFDPVTERMVGEPEAVTREPTEFLGVDVSPDGAALVTMDWQRGNVVVVASDGSGTRRVTQGTAMDRWPVWSPDGALIAFYSNRGERGTQVFTVRPDGSQLRQVTDHEGLAFFPRYRPGSAELFFVDIMSANRGTFRVSGSPGSSDAASSALPAPGDSVFFQGSRFSPSGRLLAGTVVQPVATSEVGNQLVTAVYSFETGTYRTADRRYFAGVAGWLDEERFVGATGGDTWIVDATTMEGRLLLEGVAVAGVAPDGRTLYFMRASEESDVWLATLES